MKLIATFSLIGVSAAWIALADTKHAEHNSKPHDVCDSSAFLAIAVDAEKVRAQQRLTALEFAEAMTNTSTIILDARGSEFYANLHVKGAINLPFTHFAADTLAQKIPDKSTRILIYCRNNLADAPSAFPVTPATPLPSTKNIEIIREYEYPLDYEPPEIPKSAPAGLNIPTFITLRAYGYENVWELNDIVDPNNSPIAFSGSVTQRAEQGSADQPATAPESKSEGKDKPQPESKVAPR